MSEYIINLLETNGFVYDNVIKTSEIIENNCEVIQTGIGDLLLVCLLLKNKLLSLPVYFNISTYINNRYKLNDTSNSFEFKLKLLSNIIDKKDIILYNDKHVSYSNWPIKLKFINDYKLLQSQFNLSNCFGYKYIIFHTKCRFDSSFDYNNLKTHLRLFCREFKTNYKIIIMGEKIMPTNQESDIHKITTLYEELLELKNNNDVIDLSIYNIYDNLNFENYCKDMAIIHNAECNILFGNGGQFCNSIIFGKKSVVYTLPQLLFGLDKESLNKSNIVINYNWDIFLYNLSDLLSEHVMVIGTPEIKKQKPAYFLGHNGLGDNITSIGAVNFLLNYYETIHFLCRKKNSENVNLIYNNDKVIIETVDVPCHCLRESEGFKKILNEREPDADCFILGFQNTKNFKNQITHPDLLKYVKNDSGYTVRWGFIKDFYNDIGLDLSIYYNYFNIDSCEISRKLYENINAYKVAFFHTESSSGEIDLSHIAENYTNNDEYIVICANKNLYDISHSKYEIAETYVNKLVLHYLDIIKNANVIHIVNSCFSCIVYPLLITKKISPVDWKIYERRDSTIKYISKK
jgi:hypothetical protein